MPTDVVIIRRGNDGAKGAKGDSAGADIKSLKNDYSSNLSTMVATLSTTEATVSIDVSGTLAASSLDIPSTIHLQWERNCVWGITGTVTMVNVEAGEYQLFDITGSGSVTGLKKAKPEWFGGLPTTDGSTDCATAFDQMVAASGHNIFTHWGTGYYYKVSSATAVTANHLLEGVGGDRPQIYNDGSDAYAIFTITGTDGSEIDNIRFERLNIRNGTSTTGDATNGKDCIVATYCTNITIEDCKFPDTEGHFVIRHSYSKHFRILNNIFTQWTYTAISSLTESEDTLIQGNWFGTALSTAEEQQYAVMTGAVAAGGTFGVRTWRVLDNEFEYDETLSTSNWFAINSHGGEHLWVERNKIKNYLNGIQIASQAGYWTPVVTKNVWVRDNVIDRGTASHPPADHTNHVGHGIQVQGLYWQTDGNYTIEGNYIKGMGAESPSGYAIAAGYGSNIRIVRNRIEDYYYVGIYLAPYILEGEVTYNDIKNYIGGVSGRGMYAGNAGLYGIIIDYNRIWANAADYRPAYGIYSSTAYYHNVIVGSHNDFQATTTDVVGLNWGYNVLPTVKYWRQGDLVGNTYTLGKIWAYASGQDGDGYYGWLKNAQTCTGTSGESTVTLDYTGAAAWVTSTAYTTADYVISSSVYYRCLVNHTSGTFATDLAAGKWGTVDYSSFPIGARVSITQDAPAAALSAQVMNCTTAGVLTLSTPLTADVTNGDIAMVAPTFWPMRQYVQVVTSTAISDVDERTLQSYTVPANTMKVYDRLIIRVAGTITGANGNKTIKVKWGSLVLTVHPADNNEDDWYAEVIVYSEGTTNAQRVIHRGYSGTTLVAQGYDAATEDTTAAIAIVVTGQLAHEDDTLTRTLFEITP